MRLGKYIHHKSGKYYKVLGVALATETQEKMVMYQAWTAGDEYYADIAAEYGPQPIFVRPFEMFNEIVEVGGKPVPRFEFVSAI